MAGFAAWLFGLRVQQPREYRRLMRIRRRVYTPVARLDAEIIRSAEPIPFEELDRARFRPLRPGTHWGKVFEMDATALALCMDNGLPIHVFNMDDERNIDRIVCGERVGTVVRSG